MQANDSCWGPMQAVCALYGASDWLGQMAVTDSRATICLHLLLGCKKDELWHVHVQ